MITRIFSPGTGRHLSSLAREPQEASPALCEGWMERLQPGPRFPEDLLGILGGDLAALELLIPAFSFLSPDTERLVQEGNRLGIPSFSRGLSYVLAIPPSRQRAPKRIISSLDAEDANPPFAGSVPPGD